MVRKTAASLAVVLAALLLVGCRGDYLYVQAVGAPPAPVKPGDCSLHLVDQWRYPGYVQIGFVECSRGPAGALPRTPRRARSPAARPSAGHTTASIGTPVSAAAIRDASAKGSATSTAVRKAGRILIGLRAIRQSTTASCEAAPIDVRRRRAANRGTSETCVSSVAALAQEVPASAPLLELELPDVPPQAIAEDATIATLGISRHRPFVVILFPRGSSELDPCKGFTRSRSRRSLRRSTESSLCDQIDLRRGFHPDPAQTPALTLGTRSLGAGRATLRARMRTRTFSGAHVPLRQRAC
jgi:hypothetical protein